MKLFHVMLEQYDLKYSIIEMIMKMLCSLFVDPFVHKQWAKLTGSEHSMCSLKA